MNNVWQWQNVPFRSSLRWNFVTNAVRVHAQNISDKDDLSSRKPEYSPTYEKTLDNILHWQNQPFQKRFSFSLYVMRAPFQGDLLYGLSPFLGVFISSTEWT